MKPTDSLVDYIDLMKSDRIEREAKAAVCYEALKIKLKGLPEWEEYESEINAMTGLTQAIDALTNVVNGVQYNNTVKVEPPQSVAAPEPPKAIERKPEPVTEEEPEHPISDPMAELGLVEQMGTRIEHHYTPKREIINTDTTHARPTPAATPTVAATPTEAPSSRANVHLVPEILQRKGPLDVAAIEHQMYVIFQKRATRHTLQSTLSQLKQQGVVRRNHQGEWSLAKSHIFASV